MKITEIIESKLPSKTIVQDQACVKSVKQSIDEIASAEEQLGLWKLVSDNVWQAISTQAEQEAREKEAAAKYKRSKGGVGRIASPKPTLPKITTPAFAAKQTAAKDPEPKKPSPQQALQQPQAIQSIANTAASLQPISRIAPSKPLASNVPVRGSQQAIASKAKPKLSAHAGGMTVEN
jgi:hypothetical protein